MDKFINANAVISVFCNSYTELKKDLPIRPSEMGVLNIIVQREGRFTPLMLAELLGVSKPMITAHITVLEEKQYILKESSDNDKRSFYIIPTDKAKELVKTTAQKMGGYLGRIEKALGKERFAELLEVLSETNVVLKQIKGEEK